MSAHHTHTYSSVQPRTRVLLDDAMMREILTDVGRMRAPLDLELWASWMLGQVWKQRTRQPLFHTVDWMLTVGSPMVGMIAEVGGASARKALTAISLLERGALGNYAGAIALTLPGAQTPPWISGIADARLVSARCATRPGDGAAILLDLERDGEKGPTVAVFIDDRHDGIVKWIRLVGPAASVADPDPGGDLLEPEDLDTVCQRVLRAILVTDAATRSSAEHEYADLRALLLARVLDVIGEEPLAD